jgi:diguanylate cyclase (GGDEF)-like protein
METTQPASPDDSYLNQACEALIQLQLSGKLPDDLPQAIASDPAFQQLVQQLEAYQAFALALSNGDLSQDLALKGRVAGSLKSLQASLRHLTWQAQRIASGDLSQRVAFMGDFAEAFNRMVENLRQSRESLEGHAGEMAAQRQAAYVLMLEAQATRDGLEKANRQLKEQIAETRALQDQLKEQAVRDPLTGLFNRRYMVETLDRELARAQREDYPVSLILLDVDHFKSLNDTYGHLAGDAVLQAFGEQLRSSFRRGDAPCRYGGEEFLIILPKTPLRIAVSRANHIRKAFHTIQINTAGGHMVLHATFSAGVAVFPANGTSAEELLRAADTAMYAAKAAGRDRTAASGNGS